MTGGGERCELDPSIDGLAPRWGQEQPAPALPQVPQPGTRKKFRASKQLMKRVLLQDVLECPRCQGRMRLIATITDPVVIVAILRPAPPLLAIDGNMWISSHGSR